MLPPWPLAWPDVLTEHLMTEHRDGCLARRQAMLGQEIGDGTIRSTLVPQLCDDFLCREQILEFLRTARCEFFDRLSDCGWVK